VEKFINTVTLPSQLNSRQHCERWHSMEAPRSGQPGF